MNALDCSRSDDASNLASVSADSDNDKISSALADAQNEISALRDQISEERVGWLVVCVILFNCMFLLEADNWAGPIIIGIMELSGLAIIAKRMGVEEFHGLFMGIMSRFGNMLASKEG